VVDSLGFARITSDIKTADARITKGDQGYLVWVGADSLPPEKGRGVMYAPSAQSLCDPVRRAFAIASFNAIENPANPKEFDLFLDFVPEHANPDLSLEFAPDTVRVGSPTTLYARVEAARGQGLYLSIAVKGYTSEPDMIYPQGDAMNRTVPLNQWFAVTPLFTPEDPAGLESLVAVVGAAQFDLRPLVESFPECPRTRGGGATAQTEVQPATSWRSWQHTVVILPKEGE
jgi:hypothetical protein